MATLPVIGDLDLTLHQVLNAKAQMLASNPTGVEALYYWNTVAKEWRVYNGTAWVAFGTSTYGDVDVKTLLAAMVTGNTETGITVAWQSGDSTIDFVVTDSPLLGGQNSAYHLARVNHSGTQAASTISDLATVVKAYRLDEFADPNSDIPLATFKFTGAGAGVADTDFATVGQLTAAVSGQKWKAPVRLMTQSNDTLSGLAARDGITPLAGERVLVPNQTSHAADGIYLASAGAWSRAGDADVAAELNDATVLVEEGTVSGGDIYTQTATVVTLGTTAQTWQKVGEGNTAYTADGSTIILTGTVFSLGTVLAANLGTQSVTEAKLHTSVAGAGLAGGNGTPLSVTTGAGLAISGDSVILDTAIGVRKFAADYGNGSATDVAITHSLGTKDVQVTIRRNSDDKVVLVPWTATSTSVVTINHDVAPTTNQYRAIVFA